MSARAPAPRWALSLADLSLLLLGFALLTQSTRSPALLADGVRAAFGAPASGVLERPAASLFEPGEAVLRPAAARAIGAWARGAGGITVASRGTEADAARFDGWELAAARAAAVARAVAAAGVPADRVSIAIDTRAGGGQRLALRRE